MLGIQGPLCAAIFLAIAHFFEAAAPKVTDTATPARAHEFMSDAAVEKHRAVNLTPGLAE